MEDMENAIYGLMQTMLYCGHVWLRIETARKRFVEAICMEFEHICDTVDRIYGKVHFWPHISQS
jgi:hypothetical protein